MTYRKKIPEFSSEKKEFFYHFVFQVWELGDPDAVDSFLGNQYTIFHDPGDYWHKRNLTRDEYRERLKILVDPFTNPAYKLLEMTEEDNRLAVNWTWRGTFDRPYRRIEPTGKRVSMSGLTIFYYLEDRLIGHWQVIDREGFHKQLGIKPDPALRFPRPQR